MKHHYVPQFFLKRWVNVAGRVHVFSIRNGNIVCRARVPEYTGFEHDLYGLVANTLGIGLDHIEKRLFGPIDSDAAVVLDKLERHVAITEDEHIAWTFFLSSLRMRQPDVLAFLRKDGIARMKVALAERDASTLPPGATSTEEWFSRNYPGAIEVMTLTNWLPQMIFHDQVTAAFGDLRWWIREFPSDQTPLLLSDLPVHWEGGIKTDSFMIQLPIGPHRVFFGARSEETEKAIDAIPTPELIRRINRTTLASTAGRLWAADEAAGHAVIAANRDILGVHVIGFASLAPADRPRGERGVAEAATSVAGLAKGVAQGEHDLEGNG